jgi:hypothetical protein
MKLTPESLYLQLGQLVADTPDLNTGPITPEIYQWLGRAHALVDVSGIGIDAISFSSAADHLTSQLRSMNAQKIMAIVYRALAKAELNAPATIRGAFITAGSAFDAFAAIGRVFERATTDVYIIDPYADNKCLSSFAIQAREGVRIKVLGSAGKSAPTLKPAIGPWKEQYGEKRPLEVKFAKPKALHDRLIFVDNKEAWSLTQSFSGFAAHSPASIIRIDPDLAAMKLEAYEDLWSNATNAIP